MTHTFAAMEVSPEAWDEIHGKLREAAYDHAILVRDDGTQTLDMHGVGLVKADAPDTPDRVLDPVVVKARSLLSQMADELAATYDHDYSGRHRYKFLMIKYDRDMELVIAAWKLLSETAGK